MATVVQFAEYSEHVSLKKPHYHDCHQILFITRGTANVRVNETVYAVKAGDLIVFSRFEQHAVTEQSQDYQRYILQIAPDVLMEGSDRDKVYAILFNRPTGFRNVFAMEQTSDELIRIFCAIIRERDNQNPMYENMLDLLVRQLLIFIYRQSPESLPVTEGDCFEIVYRIQTQLQRQFQKQFTLASLAEEHNISVYYLAHLFKKITGNSVMGYLQSCRIAASKKYLVETNLRIDEIVEQCGFSDNSNFSRTFRKLTGLSPSQFRQKYKL